MMKERRRNNAFVARDHSSKPIYPNTEALEEQQLQLTQNYFWQQSCHQTVQTSERSLHIQTIGYS
jgi:hypothetical protein